MKIFDSMKLLAKHIAQEVNTCRFVFKDARTPLLPKWLLGLAIAYAIMPFDLIPDVIPVLGYVDDVIIIPGLITLAYTMIPKYIIAECRQRALQ